MQSEDDDLTYPLEGLSRLTLHSNVIPSLPPTSISSSRTTSTFSRRDSTAMCL